SSGGSSGGRRSATGSAAMGCLGCRGAPSGSVGGVGGTGGRGGSGSLMPASVLDTALAAVGSPPGRTRPPGASVSAQQSRSSGAASTAVKEWLGQGHRADTRHCRAKEQPWLESRHQV